TLTNVAISTEDLQQYCQIQYEKLKNYFQINTKEFIQIFLDSYIRKRIRYHETGEE
ncbi:13328_t:CDS:1, partial [Ambispora gerdemannii]